MAADPPVPVLLLKTRSSPNDGYEDYLRTLPGRNYTPIFVPVLEHRFRPEALESLQSIISQKRLSSPDRQYGGLIFTSQRAVEAFAKVIEDLRHDSVCVEELLPADLPLYVVGPATARGLRALSLPAPVVGEASGNGEALAHFILEDYHRRWRESDITGSVPPSLLFLVGEQRRDIIPQTLQSEELRPDVRLDVDDVVVYETAEMVSFRTNFESVCVTTPQDGITCRWVVVFSPTGCEAMLEALALLDLQTRKGRSRRESQANTPQRTQIFIATIGPTTRDYLRREFDFEPDVCAPKPSPEGIGQAIAEFMSSVNL